MFYLLEREISNGQSHESISSLDEGPIAPPRKVYLYYLWRYFLEYLYNFYKVNKYYIRIVEIYFTHKLIHGYFNIFKAVLFENLSI